MTICILGRKLRKIGIDDFTSDSLVDVLREPGIGNNAFRLIHVLLGAADNDHLGNACIEIQYDVISEIAEGERDFKRDNKFPIWRDAQHIDQLIAALSFGLRFRLCNRPCVIFSKTRC